MADTNERRPGGGGVPDEPLGGGNVTASLTHHRRRPAAPLAVVSMYLPSGRRTWYWYAYSCRTCGQYQLGRCRTIDGVAGIRRAGCGHLVTIAIGRVYGATA